MRRGCWKLLRIAAGMRITAGRDLGLGRSARKTGNSAGQLLRVRISAGRIEAGRCGICSLRTPRAERGRKGLLRHRKTGCRERPIRKTSGTKRQRLLRIAGGGIRRCGGRRIPRGLRTARVRRHWRWAGCWRAGRHPGRKTTGGHSKGRHGCRHRCRDQTGFAVGAGDGCCGRKPGVAETPPVCGKTGASGSSIRPMSALPAEDACRHLGRLRRALPSGPESIGLSCRVAAGLLPNSWIFRAVCWPRLLWVAKYSCRAERHRPPAAPAGCRFVPRRGGERH